MRNYLGRAARGRFCNNAAGIGNERLVVAAMHLRYYLVRLLMSVSAALVATRVRAQAGSARLASKSCEIEGGKNLAEGE